MSFLIQMFEGNDFPSSFAGSSTSGEKGSSKAFDIDLSVIIILRFLMGLDISNIRLCGSLLMRWLKRAFFGVESVGSFLSKEHCYLILCSHSISLLVSVRLLFSHF